MLELFEVKGYKNFKDKFSLDFSKVRDYKFNTNCISNNLIKKAIIYGKNSIGKSNFGLALFDIVDHIFLNNNVNITTTNPHYLNAFSNDGHAEFHYVFKFGDDKIDYFYKKITYTKLIYEKITINDKLLYDYNYETKKGDLEGIHEINPTLNLEFHGINCIWPYLLSNSILDDNNPLKKMYNFINSMLWFRTADERQFLSLKYNTKEFHNFIFDEENLLEFENLLHAAGIEEHLVVMKDIDGQKRLYIDAVRPMYFWEVASSGTKALYGFFYWYKTAAPSLIFIDEFDAFYHYELSETVVNLLDKLKDSQIILTSHNTNLLTNRIMRPDCFFILTKDKLTSFADATDRELREGHNLEKLYQSGEFDGD